MLAVFFINFYNNLQLLCFHIVLIIAVWNFTFYVRSQIFLIRVRKLVNGQMSNKRAQIEHNLHSACNVQGQGQCPTTIAAVQ